MQLPIKALPHTATLRGRRQNSILVYDTLTAAFHVGATLAGATSHATAIIIGIPGTVITESGATIYTVPALTLLLHTITGTFVNDEVLSDNGTVPGAAVANGTTSEAFDVYGQLMYTDIDTTIACRFYSQKDAVQQAGQTLYIVTSQRVMIPAESTPMNGDLLITTHTGYAGTYTIGNVNPAPGLAGGPHHWTCDLAKAGA
jgi:hypothetical protein